nr:MAG TPA: hypothetical protein [Caudoviricetes sp.]
MRFRLSFSGFLCLKKITLSGKAPGVQTTKPVV